MNSPVRRWNIFSGPNIRNWKFLWRLATQGDFHYRDAGVLDRTHLRFFVRETVIELATCGGLAIVAAANAQPFTFPDARFLLSSIRFHGKFAFDKHERLTYCSIRTL